MDLAIVVADGLSARAVHEGAAGFLAAFRTHIDKAGWTLAPIVVATQGRVALGDGIGAALKARHPYETPIILHLPVAGADPDTAAWIAAETHGPPIG